jgi:hypothetical protein
MADNIPPFPYPGPFPSPYSEVPTPKQESVQFGKPQGGPSFPEPPMEFYKPAQPKFEEPKPKVEQVEFEDEFGDDVKRLVRGIIIFVVVMALVWVSSWYLLKGFSSTDKALISAKDGGKIVTDFGVEIEVPAGALAEDTKIEVEKTGEGAVTDVYHFLPEALVFKKSITVSIPYKDSGLLPGETPWNIRLEYNKDGLSAARSLSYTVDSKAKKLKVRMREF